MRKAGPIVALIAVLATPALPEMPRHQTQYQSPGLHLSGDARMGVVYDDGAGPDNRSRVQMTSRARLHFQLIGETTGGTQFGVGFDVDKPNRRLQGQHVFIGN